MPHLKPVEVLHNGCRWRVAHSLVRDQIINEEEQVIERHSLPCNLLHSIGDLRVIVLLQVTILCQIPSFDIVFVDLPNSRTDFGVCAVQEVVSVLVLCVDWDWLVVATERGKSKGVQCSLLIFNGNWWNRDSNLSFVT
jgi:hypothetical protein